tara:strand:- start:7464 stop:8438 length:975 start_codon:yes stop_codon:yes gene_type:complete
VSDLLGRGYCGGHVTLIFTIEDENPDPIKQGSLGAGICLNEGVEVIVRGRDGNGNLEVFFNDYIGESSMYEDIMNMINGIIPEVSEYDWEATVKLDLPTGQGFGMSAAGSISFCNAIQRALGIPYEEGRRRSLMISHVIDRKRSSGLGDVTAIAAGGIEIRRMAGSPFNGHLLEMGPGESEGWESETEVILAWDSKGSKHTSSYIDDASWKESISKAGEKNLESLLEGSWDKSRWSDLLHYSTCFSEESGLSKDGIRADVIRKCEKVVNDCGIECNGVPLLCMLGGSVAIVPVNIDRGLQGIDNIKSALENEGLTAISTTISHP